MRLYRVILAGAEMGFVIAPNELGALRLTVDEAMMLDPDYWDGELGRISVVEYPLDRAYSLPSYIDDEDKEGKGALDIIKEGEDK